VSEAYPKNSVGLAPNVGRESQSINHNTNGLTSGRAFYKIADVAQILRISESTVYRLIASRRLASVKVAGPDSAVRVRAQDLQQFIEKQRTAAVWEGDTQ